MAIDSTRARTISCVGNARVVRNAIESESGEPKPKEVPRWLDVLPPDMRRRAPAQASSQVRDTLPA
jgi:hypothetical protein